MGADPGVDPGFRKLLGIVLAGGESRRFPGQKALYRLEGRTMVDWALDAISPWTSAQGIITNEPEVAEAFDLPARPDRVPGLGPLGGLQTALAWAEEDGFDGVFLLACDVPLVNSDLVGGILRLWPMGAPAAVPGSHGPLGFEPLCAAYSTGVLPQVEGQIQIGARSMEDALSSMGAYRIPVEELGPPEELALAFTNVNTLERAREVEAFLKGNR